SKVIKKTDDNSGEVNTFFKNQNSKNQYYSLYDLIVGTNLYVYGKLVSIFDCDNYTREFYQTLGFQQPNTQEIPTDSYHLQKTLSKIQPKRDNLMKDWLEHGQGGGKVKNQKQF